MKVDGVHSMPICPARAGASWVAILVLTALAGGAIVGLVSVGCVSETEPSVPTSRDVVRITHQDRGGSGDYKFVPSEFTFKVGDTITFEMFGETEFHTFTVDALGIDRSVTIGDTIAFDVTFDRPGSFRLICIPHEVFGMQGTITVEE